MATFYQKIKLLKGLLNREVAQTGPFYVTVDITRRCNLHCLGCRFHSPLVNLPSPGDQSIQDLSPPMFRKLCAELRVMGTASLFFVSEGEPFLHPHLFDLIHQAKKAGLHVTLLTNGTLLDATRIKSLLASRLDVLQVSLWASSVEEYAANYPGTDPENFHRVVAALKLVAEIKAREGSSLPLVQLQHPINRHNFQRIEALIALAEATGCEAVSFTLLRTHRRLLAAAALSGEEEEWVCRTLTRMKKKLRSRSLSHNINQVVRRYRYGESVWEKLPCYIPWLHVRILVDGTVLPCEACELPIGNLNEESFREIWNNEALRRFRRQTLTREGLRAMDSDCDCSHCCHLEDNVRVHRVFKWFAPFRRPRP